MRIAIIQHFYHVFNSKLVRLKAQKVRSQRTHSVRFNSKLVRLKAELGSGTARPIWRSFNSKLVRLKGNTVDGLDRAYIVFQFQTGSIKSKLSATVNIRIHVSIPNWFDLKEEQKSLHVNGGARFQFQTGSI